MPRGQRSVPLLVFAEHPVCFGGTVAQDYYSYVEGRGGTSVRTLEAGAVYYCNRIIPDPPLLPNTDVGLASGRVSPGSSFRSSGLWNRKREFG